MSDTEEILSIYHWIKQKEPGDPLSSKITSLTVSRNRFEHTLTLNARNFGITGYVVADEATHFTLYGVKFFPSDTQSDDVVTAADSRGNVRHHNIGPIGEPWIGEQHVVTVRIVKSLDGKGESTWERNSFAFFTEQRMWGDTPAPQSFVKMNGATGT